MGDESTTPAKMRRSPNESFTSSHEGREGRTNSISFSAPTYSELRKLQQKGGSESFTSVGSPSNSFARRRNSIAQMQSIVGLEKKLFTGAASFYEKLVSDPVPFGTLPWVLEQRKRDKAKGKPTAARSLDMVDDDAELKEIETLLSSGPPSRRAGAASNKNSPLNSPTGATGDAGVAAEN